jgi:uncharacterized protein
VIILDANLLLYAYDSSNSSHKAARAWLERTLQGDEDVSIPLVTLLAFIRIGTHPKVFARPMGVEDAVGAVQSWLELPNVSIAEPASSHWTQLAAVARSGQARGGEVMDAHVATLAIQSGATLCTTDKGFARYDGLKRLNPIA